jgi:alpha-beta hydrolase superfamily lysophospholipase
MPYFEGSRGRIHHHAWLPDSSARAVVVLLHGYGEHLGLYDALARRLTVTGCAVHALDSVGHGRSDGERGRYDSWDDYVADARTLTRIATRRHPGAPVVLVGHSGGAVAAYLLAVRHPRLASAAVLSGAPLAPLDWVADDLAGRTQDDGEGERDLTSLVSTHPDYVHALMHDPLCVSDGFHHATLRALSDVWPETVAALADGRPSLPVLVVHGEEDPIVPLSMARYVAAALPQATLRVFPGDLHDVLNEHDRDRVHDVVADFVDEHALAEDRVA